MSKEKQGVAGKRRQGQGGGGKTRFQDLKGSHRCPDFQTLIKVIGI